MSQIFILTFNFSSVPFWLSNSIFFICRFNTKSVTFVEFPHLIGVWFFILTVTKGHKNYSLLHLNAQPPLPLFLSSSPLQNNPYFLVHFDFISIKASKSGFFSFFICSFFAFLYLVISLSQFHIFIRSFEFFSWTHVFNSQNIIKTKRKNFNARLNGHLPVQEPQQWTMVTFENIINC